MATSNGTQNVPSEKSPMRKLRELEFAALAGQLAQHVGLSSNLIDLEFLRTVVTSLNDTELYAQIEEMRDTLRTIGGVVRKR